MREQVKDKGRLEHILECIDNIYEFAGNKSFEQVEQDKMCYFIVHGYNVVDKNEVWSVIKNDLQQLRQQIDQYIDEDPMS